MRRAEARIEPIGQLGADHCTGRPPGAFRVCTVASSWACACPARWPWKRLRLAAKRVARARTPRAGRPALHVRTGQLLRPQDLLRETVAMARQRALDAFDAQQVHADAGDAARRRGAASRRLAETELVWVQFLQWSARRGRDAIS